MVTLASLPEKYFANNENFKDKIITDSHNNKIGTITIYHFRSSFDNSKIYTFIKGEVCFNDSSNNKTKYEFSVDYDENTSLDDFIIEYEKIVRKWEQIMKIIIKEIEVL